MSSSDSYRAPQTAQFNLKSSRARIEVDSAEEAQVWLDKAAAGDFIVRLEQRLDEGVEIEVLLVSGVLEVSMRCRVKQVFRSGADRYGTMVEWLDREGAPEHLATESKPVRSSRSLFEPSRPQYPNEDPEPGSDAFELPSLKVKDGEPEVNLNSPESWAAQHFPEVEDLRLEVRAPAPEKVESAQNAPDTVVEPVEDAPSSTSRSMVLKRKTPRSPDDSTDVFDVASLNPDSSPDLSLEFGAEQDVESHSEEDRAAGEVAAIAERGADELEVLLSQSGEWRARVQDGRLTSLEVAESGAGSAPADDAPAADGPLDDAPADNAPADNAPVDDAPPDEKLSPEAKKAITFNESRGVSLAHSLGQMNPNEKARLATRASRQERQLLLRDHTFSVQMGLLNNPRIENKEIIKIAKHPQTTGGILKRLASDRKWAGNYEVQVALVKHPGTPSPMAIRLLEQMRISDLRAMAKSQALRENVRKAALRLYLQRSG